MKIYIFTILTVFLFSAFCFGQSDLPIISTISDLKNLKKVYIVTESTQDRKFILLALKKKKSSLEIVNDPKDAEFFLEFKQLSRQDKKVLIGSQYTETGEMTAYFYNSDKKKVIAWSESKLYYESSGISVESPNSYVLTRKFINALTGKK